MSGELGLEAERLAADYLESAGLAILDRRWRGAGGELDLVACEGDVVVFVEVKARGGSAFGRPEDAVGPSKRRRIERAAVAYLAARGLTERPARFDVVSVTPAGVTHLPDAFRPE